MVAYSFKERFIPKIRAGIKSQTIRLPRRGRGRHARPGDEVQLYYAMRTAHCRLIGRAICESVEPIVLDFDRLRVDVDSRLFTSRRMRDLFAVRDGFENWTDLVEFWRNEHGERTRRDARPLLPGDRAGRLAQFEGELIKWRDYVDEWGGDLMAARTIRA